MNNGDKSLGEFLRERRTEKKIKIRELARRTRYTASYLSKVERGECQPGELCLLAYAHQLGLGADALLLRAQRVPQDVVYILSQRPDLLNFIRNHATTAECESGAMSAMSDGAAEKKA